MYVAIGDIMCKGMEKLHIEFEIPGAPVAKGRPKFSTYGGFPKAYTPAKTRNAEAFVKKCFLEQVKDFKMPNKGPIMLYIVFFMPVPTSISKKKHKELVEKQAWHTKKPDLDNLVKLVNDALNGVAWEDDGCISFTQAIKCYGATPKTCVEIDYL